MSPEPTDAPIRRLADYRLIFLGSASGETAVSDYSDNFFQAVRPYFADAVDYRMPGAKNATLADVRRHRKAIRPLQCQQLGHTLHRLFQMAIVFSYMRQ